MATADRIIGNGDNELACYGSRRIERRSPEGHPLPKTSIEVLGALYAVDAQARGFLEAFLPKAIETGDHSAIIAVIVLGEQTGQIIPLGAVAAR